MTNIPRSFLIPYLKQISLAEIACHDKEKEIKDKRNEIQAQNQKMESMPYPIAAEKEHPRHYWDARIKRAVLMKQLTRIPVWMMSVCLVIFFLSFLFALILLMLSIIPMIHDLCFLILEPWVWAMGMLTMLDTAFWLRVVLVGFACFCGYTHHSRVLKERDDHSRALCEQNSQLRRWEEEREKAERLSRELEQLKMELGELEKTRDRIYSRNIIPYPYRSMYPVVYLYDYFRGCYSCQQEDIPTVLQTFVMDSKLDKVIEELREMRYLLSMM